MYARAGAWVHNGDAVPRHARRRTKPRKGPGGGARAASKPAAPAKRPARLDDRLSSDGGSARRRGAGQSAVIPACGSKAEPQQKSKEGRPHLGGHWPMCRRRRGGWSSLAWSRAEVAEQGASSTSPAPQCMAPVSTAFSGSPSSRMVADVEALATAERVASTSRRARPCPHGSAVTSYAWRFPLSSTPSPFPSPSGLRRSKKKTPRGLLDREQQRIWTWEQFPKGRRRNREGRLVVAFIGGG
jgi:hypothetical protein